MKVRIKPNVDEDLPTDVVFDVTDKGVTHVWILFEGLELPYGWEEVDIVEE